MNVQEVLNAPVPFKNALVCVAAAVAGSAIASVIQYNMLVNKANAQIRELGEKNAILHESVNFLLERADPDTLGELNNNLEFWVVVKEMDVPSSSEEQA